MKFIDRTANVISEVYCMLVKGKDESGQPQYAYVAVHSSKLDIFKRMAKMPNFHPDKLGKIVYARRGEWNAELHKEILEKYIRNEGVELLEGV